MLAEHRDAVGSSAELGDRILPGGSGRDVPQVPHRAVEAVHDLLGHLVDPVDDGGCPGVGGSGFRLLLVGEGHRPEDQDLVDLRRVEQVAGALGSDLRPVVERDGGGEHHVLAPAVADHHREGVEVGAGFGGGLCPLGWLEQGDEPPGTLRGQAQQGVAGDKRVAHRLLAGVRVAVVGGEVLGPHRQPDGSERPVQALRGEGQHRAEGLARPQHPCGQGSRGVVDELGLLCRGLDIDRDGLGSGEQPVHRDRHVDLVLHGLLPGDEGRAVDRHRLDGGEFLTFGAGWDFDDLGLHMQEPHP